MDGPNAIFYWLGVEATLGFLWAFALLRAASTIQTSTFFKKERPLPRIEFWRYVFCSTLFCVISAIIIVDVSRQDAHYPIYKSPTAIARLILTNLIAGLALGLCSWLQLKLAMAQGEKFHRPNLATWKGIRFWGPKKRKITPEERILFLQKMDLTDYLAAIKNTVISFALLPFMFLWFDLMTRGTMQGFAPVFKSFFHHLLSVEIILAILACLIGSVGWLLKKLFLWLGWLRTFC